MPPPCSAGASAWCPSPRRCARCSRIAWRITAWAPAAPASAWARPSAATPAGWPRTGSDLIAALCAESAEQDGAECIILAGGPLAGIAPLLQPRIAVPLVDGTQAAVRLAEAMVGLMPRHPRAHRARALTGFATEVAGLYRGP